MENESNFLVYSTEGHRRDREPGHEAYQVTIWRPSLTRIQVPTLDFWTSLMYWTCFQLGLFRSREYAVILVKKGAEIIHRTCLLPAFWRWPFLNKDDLQVSAVWTAPPDRSQGIATSIAMQAISTFARPGRRFWYITRKDNYASIRVCSKAGFQLAGTARRTNWLGLRVLGQFVIDTDLGGNLAYDENASVSVPLDPLRNRQTERAAA